MTPTLEPLAARSGSANVLPSSTGERLNTWPYSSAARAERLIAVSRTVLAVFALLTVWIDPREPAKHADISYFLLASYAAYSTVLLVVVWTSHAAVKPLRLVTQVLDLVLYTVFIYLTEGTTSPYFAYLVFSILCGAVRWRWRGALAAATAAIATYVGLGIYVAEVLHDPTFELDRFIFRAVYLAVIAGILTSVGAYEEQVRAEIRRLAEWPRLVPADQGELLRQLLGHAARVLGSPRVLIISEEPEEPWQHVALWSPLEFRFGREPPDRYSPLVADVLERVPFMCRDAAAKDERVLCAAGDGLREWRGQAIHPGLIADFGLHSVLALPLPGERLSGWLFYLDKTRLSVDEMALGTISAREIIASLDHAELLTRQRESAIIDERTRLGRDLHDGLLQSLTAARLQLHQLARQSTGAGIESREKLEVLEASITANQRELRRLVEELRPGAAQSPQALGLADELDQLQERMRRDWGLEVRAQIDRGARVRPAVAREVYLMIHEALVNAARHGGASTVEMRVAEDRERLTVSVTDNGRGFPFEGRRDQIQLAREHIGPVSLRERVASLHGTLIVDSTSRGARIELTIPIREGR